MTHTVRNCSNQTTINFLSLGKILQDSYGVSIVTAKSKDSSRRTGWTTEQLLAMANAKSYC